MYNFDKLRKSLNQYFPNKFIFISYETHSNPCEKCGGVEETFWLDVEDEVDMVSFSTWKELAVFCNKMVLEEYMKGHPGSFKTPIKDVWVGRSLN